MTRGSFSLLLLVFGCVATAQVSSEVQRIEFESVSRGYLKRISISTDSLIITEDSRNVDTVMRKGVDSKGWNDLLVTMSDVTLEEVQDLPSPGNKRTYDAARHSTIRIVTADKTYMHNFDNENPHHELEGLMKEIIRLSDSVSPGRGETDR